MRKQARGMSIKHTAQNYFGLKNRGKGRRMTSVHLHFLVKGHCIVGSKVVAPNSKSMAVHA